MAGRLLRCAGAACLGWVLALVAAAPARAGLHAERISAERFAALRVAGPDSDGGVGDWALGNDILCAVVSDPSHESPLSSQGGVLVDLGRCGRADDQWSTLQPLMDFSRERVVPLDAVHAEQTGQEAAIVTEGRRDGVRVRTRYAVDVREPTVLRITTRLERTAPGARLFAYGDVVLHAEGQLRPFGLDLEDPARSIGFAHPPADPDSRFALVRAIVPDDLHVLVGGDALQPGIAYGLELRGAHLERSDGSRQRLPTLSVSGKGFTMIGAFSEPFWFHEDGAPGLMQLAQIPFMDLAKGERLVVEVAIRVGDRADAASVTDGLFPEGTRVSGRADDPHARLHVATASGAPITEVRPAADGSFSMRLPPGSYRLRAVAPGGRSVEREFAVAGEPVTLAPLAVGAAARVRLPRERIMRLVFVGEDGTPDPRFGDDLLGFRVGSEEVPSGLLANAVSLAGTAADPSWATLPPGHYRVIATRGPEYGVAEQDLSVSAGETLDLSFAPLPHVVETPGWIAADLHVHSAESFDSSLPLPRQIQAYAAFGDEVMVETEHDRVVDPEPWIRRLGLGDELAGLPGVEATGEMEGGETPYTPGHWNAFPLPPEPGRPRGGAPDAEGRRPREIHAQLLARPGPPIFQMNHPLGASEALEAQRYLTHLGVAGRPYDATRSLAATPNQVLLERDAATGLRDLDFDAIELMNGSSRDAYRRTRAVWLSWLLQGEARTATANSDSHRAGQLPALPRNYVRLDDDDPARLHVAAFRESVRGHHVIGTTGPFLDVRLGPAGVGDVFTGSQGTLIVDVAAAPWVPVAELRIYVNGSLAVHRPMTAGTRVEAPLHFEGDSFVTVEVEGPATGVYAQVAPAFTPFAFTNPIFVDADEDGSWTPPGLPGPEALPPAIHNPLGP